MTSTMDRVRARHLALNGPRGASGGRKGFSQPPFWSDGARIALSGSGLTPGSEGTADDFEAVVQELYKGNGLVFQLIMARKRVFSQIRFQFREFNTSSTSGTRPGKLFGTSDLAILETPWPNGSTGQLLGHAEVHSSLAGNFYGTMADAEGRIGRAAWNSPTRFIAKMRPDWVTLLIDAPSGNLWNVDARVIGLAFHPPGMEGDRALVLAPDEFCHYAPIPDPAARWRGMSWLTPVIREIQGDNAATGFKNAFYANAATPKMAVKVDSNMEDDEFDAFVTKFRQVNEGKNNAFKTLFLANGADATPLSASLRDLDFSAIQSKGETRLAGAAGVHPSMAGLSEGLQGPSLNTGNFGAARRIFVDSTMRDLWSQVAVAFQAFCPAPRPLSHLWYDDRDIPFLREDARDGAEVQGILTSAINTLITSGWEPDAATQAVMSRDFGLLLGHHTGLFSVQLQPPGTTQAAPAALPAGQNGNTPTPTANGRAPAPTGGR